MDDSGSLVSVLGTAVEDEVPATLPLLNDEVLEWRCLVNVPATMLLEMMRSAPKVISPNALRLGSRG